MTKDIHTGLVALLENNVLDSFGKPLFKTVEMWANNFEHEMADQNDEKPRLLPACYIEYADIEEKGQSTNKQLQKNFKTILHIVYASMKDNDATILATKQQCYKYVQWFEASTCSKFQWKAELFNYDYRDLRYMQQIYFSTLKDFDAMNVPNIGSVGTMTQTIILHI